MTTQASHAPLPSLMQRLADAFRPLHARGALLDAPAHRLAPSSAPARHAPVNPDAIPVAHLARFVAGLRQLLAATDESTRRHLEQEVLDLAVPLQAAGLFDVLRIAHAPLATMVADHLAAATMEESPALR